MLILTTSVGLHAYRAIERARIASASTQVGIYEMALHTYYLDTGTYPTEEQGLAALWDVPTLDPVPTNWNGPYTNRHNHHRPMGRTLPLRGPGAHNLPFAVYSYGADRLPGGENEYADISISGVIP